MNRLKGRLLFPALFLLFWSMASISLPKTLRAPAVKLLDISIGSMSFSSAQLVVHLAVDNPNDYDIVVREIRYGLRLKEKLIKHGTIRQRERFSAGVSREVRVPVVVAYDEHFSSIMAALGSESSSVYEIRGDIQIEGHKTRFHFHHRGSLKLPKLFACKNLDHFVTL